MPAHWTQQPAFVCNLAILVVALGVLGTICYVLFSDDFTNISPKKQRSKNKSLRSKNSKKSKKKSRKNRKSR